LLAGPGLDEAIDAVPPGEVLGWGVVANVVRERLHGEELEVRSGLKPVFGAGAADRAVAVGARYACGPVPGWSVM
jgi:hypothetical protein